MSSNTPEMSPSPTQSAQQLSPSSPLNWSMIYASTLDNGIGLDNKLPWHIPQDLIYFRKIKSRISPYHPLPVIIMGALTFRSIGRPLPNRLNIVLSKTDPPSEFTLAKFANIIWCKSREQVIQVCKEKHKEWELGLECRDEKVMDVFVIGGSMVYGLFEDTCETVYHTLIKGDYMCDVFYRLKSDEWHVKTCEETEDADYRVLKRGIKSE